MKKHTECQKRQKNEGKKMGADLLSTRFKDASVASTDALDISALLASEISGETLELAVPGTGTHRHH